MKKELLQLLDESIRLELNVAEIYNVFCAAFSEDADFWWKLLLEEKNHAALLQSGKDRFIPKDAFPKELISSSLEHLQGANKELVALIKKYRVTPPSREATFNIALKLEQSAGEIHLQKFMEKKSESKLDEIFQRLSGDNKDHATRIRSYMKSYDINIQKIEL